ncbi:hypothetical protein KSS87_015665 [Heliosperma pusillum]|nr:hypothetical protein KSS87_015665 [Heliosperma pusillum]
MPKKMGVNSKAEEARLRKAASESDKRDKQARDKEEQYWQAAEGPKSKSAKKREEDEAKRAETAAKKAEARRLAEIEAAEIDKALKSKAADKKAARVAVPVPKVTEAELRRRKEAEAEAMAKVAEDAKKKSSRMADEEEYEKIVLVQNLNRDESVIEAHGLDEAIAKIVVNESLPVDKHPEKRLKASFKVFEEAELPKLKAEKPGLTHTQYKDLIWKMWKKSPDNPLNKVQE